MKVIHIYKGLMDSRDKSPDNHDSLKNELKFVIEVYSISYCI